MVRATDWSTSIMMMDMLILGSILTISKAQPTPTGNFSMGSLNDTNVLAQLVSDKVDVTPFIIGGNDAAVGEYPWMALVIGVDYFGVIQTTCGGVLIRPNWVLSALHCLIDQDGTLIAPRYTAFLGVTDISNFAAESYMFEGKSYRPEYLEFASYYTVAIENLDLVILELSTPSALPHLDIPAEDPSATIAVVAGWGVDESGISALVLQFLDDVPVLSDSSCSYFKAAYDLSYYRCAGYLQGIDGPCHGDSGGPLIIPNAAAKHGFDLVGTVVAAAGACTQPGTAELYTDLVVVKDFVEAIVGPPTTQPKTDPTPCPKPDPGETTHRCSCSCSCTNGLEYEYEHNFSCDACT